MHSYSIATVNVSKESIWPFKGGWHLLSLIYRINAKVGSHNPGPSTILVGGIRPSGGGCCPNLETSDECRCWREGKDDKGEVEDNRHFCNEMNSQMMFGREAAIVILYNHFNPNQSLRFPLSSVR